jgi:homospermidine synthase
MLAEYLTTYKNNEIAHRPTVVFVYDPCLLAKQSLQELEARNFQLQSNRIVLDSQINSGIEKMGCLLLSPDYGAWWTGSILSTEEAIALAPGHNAVVLHVAAGLISALLFMLKNPQLGVLFPEDLNHHEILEHALPYLGTLVSKASAWRPHKNKEDLQFQNFLVDKAIF